MKAIIAAAVVSLVAGAAAAQTQTTTTVTKTTRTTIAPSEQTVIKEYVTREHRPSVPPPAGFELRAGVPLPQTVELYPFPPEARWHNYRYAVIGGETVVVDPASREVVSVIR